MERDRIIRFSLFLSFLFSYLTSACAAPAQGTMPSEAQKTPTPQYINGGNLCEPPNPDDINYPSHARMLGIPVSDQSALPDVLFLSLYGVLEKSEISNTSVHFPTDSMDKARLIMVPIGFKDVSDAVQTMTSLQKQVEPVFEGLPVEIGYYDGIDLPVGIVAVGRAAMVTTFQEEKELIRKFVDSGIADYVIVVINSSESYGSADLVAVASGKHEESAYAAAHEIIHLLIGSPGVNSDGYNRPWRESDLKTHTELVLEGQEKTGPVATVIATMQPTLYPSGTDCNGIPIYRLYPPGEKNIMNSRVSVITKLQREILMMTIMQMLREKNRLP
jgi:hypothetical protein